MSDDNPPPEITTLDDLGPWPSGVQFIKGSYKITLLGVGRDLPTTQAASFTMINSVVPPCTMNCVQCSGDSRAVF